MILYNRLSVNHLLNLIWTEASADFTVYNTVSIWRIAVSSFVPKLNEFKALLQPQEIEKAMRYQQENDQNQRIISKAVLRILLNKYTKISPKAIRFSADQNKKPYFENDSADQIHFNISHSGNYILIAIASNPIGIDVEKIDTSFTWQNMSDSSLSKIEADFVENSANPSQSFYQLWTRKESLLKATGKGLVDDLAQIPSLDGIYQDPFAINNSNENRQITSFKVDENYIGSVAFIPVKTAIRFFNFQL